MSKFIYLQHFSLDVIASNPHALYVLVSYVLELMWTTFSALLNYRPLAVQRSPLTLSAAIPILGRRQLPSLRRCRLCYPAVACFPTDDLDLMPLTLGFFPFTAQSQQSIIFLNQDFQLFVQLFYYVLCNFRIKIFSCLWNCFTMFYVISESRFSVVCGIVLLCSM
nr:hypothetical protein Iba_chr03eCG2540 [Ipomoea batatas]